MTTVSPPLISDAMVETTSGKKAVMFQYRLYLLPDGNLQSSISNVDPGVIIKVFNESNMEPETTNMIAGAIKQLLRESEELDRRLEAYLKSL